MTVDVRVGNRIISCLDSAPSPSELAQHFAPATPADAAPVFGPRHVLLFLHAFPLNAAMWDRQVAAAPPGWRCLAPDMRGCGHSQPDDLPGSAAPSLDDYASDALGLLDRLGVHRFVVAGLSMGGYTAFSLLRLAASRVEGLILCNTKTEADSEEARSARRDTLVVLDREGVAGVADRSLPRLLGPTTRRSRPEVERAVRAMACGNSVEGVRAAIIRLMNRPDSAALLPAITCPTLVVGSDEDVVTPIDQAQAMQRAIPGAQLAVIPEAGHLSNLEQPDLFDATLRRFLETRFGD